MEEGDQIRTRAAAFVKLFRNKPVQDEDGLALVLNYHITNQKPGKQGPVRKDIDKAAWKIAWETLKNGIVAQGDFVFAHVRENRWIADVMTPAEWLKTFPSIAALAARSDALLKHQTSTPGPHFFLLYYYTQFIATHLMLRKKLKRFVPYGEALGEFIDDVRNKKGDRQAVNGMQAVYLTPEGDRSNSKQKNEWENTVLCRLLEKLEQECVPDITLPLPAEMYGTILGDETELVSIDLSMWRPLPLTPLLRLLKKCTTVLIRGEDKDEAERVLYPPFLGPNTRRLRLESVVLPDIRPLSRRIVTPYQITKQPALTEVSLISCLWLANGNGTELCGGDGITAIMRAIAPNCSKLSLRRCVHPSPVLIKKTLEEDEELPIDLAEAKRGVVAGLPASLRALKMIDMYSASTPVNETEDNPRFVPFTEIDLDVMITGLPAIQFLEQLHLRGAQMQMITLSSGPFRGLTKLQTLVLWDLDNLVAIESDTLQPLKRLKQITIQNCRNVDLSANDEYNARLGGRTGFFLSPDRNSNNYGITVDKSGTEGWQKAVKKVFSEREEAVRELERRIEERRERKANRKKRYRLVRRGGSDNSMSIKDFDKLLQIDLGIRHREECRNLLPNPYHWMAVTNIRPWWYTSELAPWTWMFNYGWTTHVDEEGRGDFYFELEDTAIPIDTDEGARSIETLVFDTQNPGDHEQKFVQSVRLTSPDITRENLARAVLAYGWLRDARVIPVLVNFGSDVDDFIYVLSPREYVPISLFDTVNSKVNKKYELIRQEGVFVGLEMVAGRFALNQETRSLEFTVTLEEAMRILGAQVLSCMLAVPGGLTSAESEYAFKKWEDEDLILPAHLEDLRNLLYGIILDIESRPRDIDSRPFYRAAMDNNFILLWQMASAAFVFYTYAKGSDAFEALFDYGEEEGGRAKIDEGKLAAAIGKLRSLVKHINMAVVAPAMPESKGYTVLSEYQGEIVEGNPNIIRFPLPSDSIPRGFDDALLRNYLNKRKNDDARKALLEQAATLATVLKKRGIKRSTVLGNMRSLFDTEVETATEEEAESTEGLFEDDIDKDDSVVVRRVVEVPTGEGAEQGLKRQKALVQADAVVGSASLLVQRFQAGSFTANQVANAIVSGLDAAHAAVSLLPALGEELDELDVEDYVSVAKDADRATGILDNATNLAAEAYTEIQKDIDLETAEVVQSSIETAIASAAYYKDLAATLRQRIKDDFAKMNLTEARIQGVSCNVCERITDLECQDCRHLYCSAECMNLDHIYHEMCIGCVASSESCHE